MSKEWHSPYTTKSFMFKVSIQHLTLTCSKYRLTHITLTCSKCC
jgi:hypothetical protein